MGTETTNQTTRVEPPAYALPYLKQGLGFAQTAMNQGGPQQYAGNTVVPFSPATEAAQANITSRALNGSPVTASAQNLATNTMNGAYLNSNPHLDAAFQRAADQSRLALDSQFAGYGRNLHTQLPFRTQQLNDLATNFYFNNYNAERDRQQSMVQQANSLANNDYYDQAQLRAVGQDVEGLAGRIVDDRVRRWDFEQMRPELALDQYLARVNGSVYGNTTKTPLYENKTNSAIGGAMAGYSMSNGNPYAAILGGILGGFG